MDHCPNCLRSNKVCEGAGGTDDGGCVRHVTLSYLSTCTESKLSCEFCILPSWKACQQVPGLPANKPLLALQTRNEAAGAKPQIPAP